MDIEFQVKTINGNALQFRGVDYSARIYTNPGNYHQIDDRRANAVFRFLLEMKSELLYYFIDLAPKNPALFYREIESFIKGTLNNEC